MAEGAKQPHSQEWHEQHLNKLIHELATEIITSVTENPDLDQGIPNLIQNIYSITMQTTIGIQQIVLEHVEATSETIGLGRIVMLRGPGRILFWRRPT